MHLKAFASRPSWPSRPWLDGAVAGALAALLVWQLGVLDLSGIGHFAYVLAGLVLVGIAAGAAGRQALLFWLDGALLLVFLIVLLTPVMRGSAARWVRDDGPLVSRVDAVAVLSSSVNADSSLDPEASERLLTGLDLIKGGAAPRLVTSRVHEEFDGTRVDSDAGQRRLVHLAGADSLWSTVDSVHSTHDEATQMARLLLPAGARSIALVTSPMHTRRACATFERAGFRVHCVASGEGLAVTRHPVTSLDRLAAFREYVYERLGMVEYRAKGWLPN